MRRNSIILELIQKGYQPAADLSMSKGDTVYKYKLPSGITERLYLPESNIDEPFFGMNKSVVERLCRTKENFYTIFLSTRNSESYVVNKSDIVNMHNNPSASGVSTDKNGNYKITASDMHKINAMQINDIHLSEFIREQL